jgi:hypothetical protein
VAPASAIIVLLYYFLFYLGNCENFFFDGVRLLSWPVMMRILLPHGLSHVRIVSHPRFLCDVSVILLLFVFLPFVSFL